MSKKYHKRLQGDEWYEIKDKLYMTDYKINERGHIKGFYKDIDGNLYSHWFSNKEISEFIESHKDEESLYPKIIGSWKIVNRPSGGLTWFSRGESLIKEDSNPVECIITKVKDVRDYIDKKIEKSFDVDFGRSDHLADRLFTETIVELQLVIQKLDEIIESKGENNG
jgi:hypothetical protein